MSHNDSERFESRFVTVKIHEKTNSIMLKGMEKSTLGVWVAHGEGKFMFKNKQSLNDLIKNNCIALSYIDDDGKVTNE